MSKIISSLVVKIGADLTQFQQGMKKASKDLKSFGNTMTSVGSTLTKGITVPVVAAVTALSALSVKAGKAADELITLSNKTGISVKNLQELQYASRFVDVEVETMTGSMIKLTRAMDDARDGTEEQKAAFDRLGVAYTNSDGSLRNAKEVWLDVVDSLGRMSNEAERDAISLELFGRSAAELNPLIAAGSKELERLGKEAEETGAIISDESVAALGELDDEMERMKAQLAAAGSELAVSFAPALKELAPIVQDTIVPAIKTLAEILADILEEFSNLSPGMQKFILSLGVAAVAAGPVATGVGKVSKGLGTLTGWLAKAAKPVAGIGSAATAASGSVGGLGAALSLLSGPLIAIGAGLAAIAIGKIYVDKAIAEMEAEVAANANAVTAAAERAKAKIAEQHKTRITAIEDEMAAEDAAYSKRLEALSEENAAEQKSAAKSLQQLRKNLSERQAALDKSHDEAIRLIQEEYGVWEETHKSRTDTVQEEADSQKAILSEILDMAQSLAEQEGKAYEETYAAILDRARDVHDEKMAMYIAEYQRSVALINQDLAKTVKGLQGEIDGIKNKNKEKQKLDRDSANRAKLLELQSRIDNAKTNTVRRAANAALAAEINRQNEEREEEAQAIQLESLEKQIETAIEKANEDKENALKILNEKTSEQQVVIDAATKHTIEQIQAERIEKEAAENAKYEAAKSALDREEEALDNYGDSYGSALDEQLKAKQQLEADKLKATKERLQAEIDAEEKKSEEEQKRYDRILERMERAMNGTTTHETSGGYESGGGGRSFGIPGFADGVSNWRGGIARINEQGGEIRYLPNGTTVIPNDVSMEIARAIGNVSRGDISINLTGPITVRKDSDIDLIGKTIRRELQREDLAAGRV